MHDPLTLRASPSFHNPPPLAPLDHAANTSRQNSTSINEFRNLRPCSARAMATACRSIYMVINVEGSNQILGLLGNIYGVEKVCQHMSLNGSPVGQNVLASSVCRCLLHKFYKKRNRTSGIMDISLGPQVSGIQQVTTHGIGSSIELL